jgi:proteasome lid subunit RPN8/RPN11
MGRIEIRALPKLRITDLARQKIRYYTRAVQSEIAGLGEVVEYPGILLVRDVFILEQSASLASAEIDPDALARLTAQLADKAERIKYFWHSHGNMSCYFSGTDNATIEAFGSPYLISTVVNRRGRELHRLDVFEPFRLSLENLRMETLDKSLVQKMASREVERLVHPEA